MCWWAIQGTDIKILIIYIKQAVVILADGKLYMNYVFSSIANACHSISVDIIKI